jgi:hypothetical protein
MRRPHFKQTSENKMTVARLSTRVKRKIFNLLFGMSLASNVTPPL